MLINFPLQSFILLLVEQQLSPKSETPRAKEGSTNSQATLVSASLDRLTRYYPNQYNFLIAIDLGLTIYWVKLSYSLSEILHFSGLSQDKFNELIQEITSAELQEQTQNPEIEPEREQATLNSDCSLAINPKREELNLLLENFLTSRLHRGLTLSEISEIKIRRLTELWERLNRKGEDYCKQRYLSHLARLEALSLASLLAEANLNLNSGYYNSNESGLWFPTWEELKQELQRRFSLPIGRLNQVENKLEITFSQTEPESSKDLKSNFGLAGFALAFDSFGLSASQSLKAVVTKLEDSAKQAWVKIPELELTAILKLADCLHLVQQPDNFKQVARKLKISQLLNLKQELEVQLIYPPFADKSARVRLAPQQVLNQKPNSASKTNNLAPEAGLAQPTWQTSNDNFKLKIGLPGSFKSNKLEAIRAEDYFAQKPLAYLSQLIGAELTSWLGLNQQVVLTKSNLKTRELLSSRVLDLINALSLRPELLGKELDLVAADSNRIKLGKELSDLTQFKETNHKDLKINLEPEFKINKSGADNLELSELDLDLNPVFTQDSKTSRFNAQQFQQQLEQQAKNRDEFAFQAFNLVDKFGISYKLENTKAFTIVDINQHRLGAEQVKLALQKQNLFALYGLHSASEAEYYRLRDLFEADRKVNNLDSEPIDNSNYQSHYSSHLSLNAYRLEKLKLQQVKLTSKQELLSKEIENKLIKSSLVDIALLTNLLALPQVLHLLDLSQTKGQCLVDFISLGKNASTVFNLAIQVLLESDRLKNSEASGSNLVREQGKLGKEVQYLTGSSILELHYPRNGVSLAEQQANSYEDKLGFKLSLVEKAEEDSLADNKAILNRSEVDLFTNNAEIKLPIIYTEKEILECYLTWHQARFLVYLQNKAKQSSQLSSPRVRNEQEQAWQMLNSEDLYLNQSLKNHYLYSQASGLVEQIAEEQNSTKVQLPYQANPVQAQLLSKVLVTTLVVNQERQLESSNLVRDYAEIEQLISRLENLVLNSSAIQNQRFKFLIDNEDELNKLSLNSLLSVKL